MKRLIPVILLTVLPTGCAHDSPCVPVYDDQGHLVYTNICIKGTTQDNWETAGVIVGGVAAAADLTMGIITLSKQLNRVWSSTLLLTMQYPSIR